MKIFTEIRDSIYNPNFYKSIPAERTLGQAFRYLAKLALVVAVIGVIIFSFNIPSLSRTLKEAGGKFVNIYPDDLTVTIKDGMASTNKEEPLTIPWGKLFPENTQYGTTPRLHNILVIDTTHPFSIDQFNSYSTYIWLTKTEVAMIKNFSGQQIQITSIGKMNNIQITKQWIMDKEAIFVKIMPWLMLLLVIIIFLGIFMGAFVGTAVIVLFYGFVVWLMSKVKKVELSYKNSYKIGLYAMTILTLISVFSSPLGIPNYFLVNLIIFMIVVYANFFNDSTRAQKENEPSIRDVESEEIK